MSAELRALAEKATPGPWTVLGPAEFGDRWVTGPRNRHITALESQPQDAENAAYIAAASPDVILAILDERDAAIRRAADVSATLAGLVRSVIWMKQGIPPGGSLGSEWGEFLRRTGDVNQWLDQSEAALRSQESQKPPETDR